MKHNEKEKTEHYRFDGPVNIEKEDELTIEYFADEQIIIKKNGEVIPVKRKTTVDKSKTER